MTIKPLIKWVGGKTQIIDTLYDNFQKIISDKPLENYHEVFLGGGSVLLSLLFWIREGKIKALDSCKFKAYDLNKVLVSMFINVRDKPEELYIEIKPMIEYYNSVPEDKKEEYYYIVRKHYNEATKKDFKSIGVSAMFIFLNKTGFRGLYREGPNGYNVPFGHYKNPEILNYEHLMDVSFLIKDVEFSIMDFNESLDYIISHDYEKTYTSFVYLDPPYVPENSKSFTKYNESDFSLEKHKLLFDLCHKLHISFIMSNSDVELVKESFNDVKYTIQRIECKRSINSKNPGAKAMEVIITNF
jgi:DNA adenine methylase